MYFDRCDDPVYYSGEQYMAEEYYRQYCMKRGLEFIPYELMERLELDELKNNLKR